MTKTLQLFFILLLLFMVGCGTQKRIVVQKQALPEWFTNPPQSTATDLYAIGYGVNRDAAITDALTQMISTLSVSVSSTFHAKTVVKSGTIESRDATYVDNSQSEVTKIRISNYTILQAKEFGFKKYGMLIRSNKEKLFRSMAQDIAQKWQLFEAQERVILQKNKLAQLAFYKKALDSFALLPNELLIMSELHPEFDTTDDLHKLSILQSKYNTTHKAISFDIDAQYDAKHLRSVIAKGLNAKRFNLSRTKGKGHFSIYIFIDIQRANAYGFTLARSAITIVTRDYKGEIIGSNKLNITGQSSQGYAIAKENIAIKLNQKVQKEGIAKVLGIAI